MKSKKWNSYMVAISSYSSWFRVDTPVTKKEVELIASWRVPKLSTKEMTEAT